MASLPQSRRGRRHSSFSKGLGQDLFDGGGKLAQIVELEESAPDDVVIYIQIASESRHGGCGDNSAVVVEAFAALAAKLVLAHHLDEETRGPVGGVV